MASEILLAPTGALVLMMVYDIYIYIHPLFQILSIYAFLYCYKCHSKSLKQYQCNWCHRISWGYFGDIFGILLEYFWDILGFFLVIHRIVLAPGQPLRGGGRQASWKDMRQGSRKWRYIIAHPKRIFLFSLWPIYTKTYVLGTLKSRYQMLQKLCKYSFIFLSHGRDRL